jgi:YidC/Oxa1 family membrane protein insertase
MSWWVPNFALLQSNDAIAEAVRRGAEGAQGLKVIEQSYGGMTGGFALIFLKLIEFWDLLFHSYGLAIIVTVLTIRLLVFPLTRMQIRAMKVMQYITPVQKIVSRYYPNRQDQNSKMMELYQEYKINPFAGCLPLIIQMPILFGVYRALYDPMFAGHSFLGVQLLFPVGLTGSRTMGHGPDMAELVDVTVAALSLQNQIWSIPVNVPFIGGQFIYWPALVLVLLYAGSSIMLQRVMKKVNAPHPEFEAELQAEFKGKGEESNQPDFAAQMQRQMGLMNVMILVMALFFSAGALLYFVVQNILMALEYTLLGRSAEPAFNVADMKAFIRRPPPPLHQRGLVKAEPGSNGKEEQSKPQGAEPDPSSGNGTGGPQQPRRKRRKR